MPYSKLKELRLGYKYAWVVFLNAEDERKDFYPDVVENSKLDDCVSKSDKAWDAYSAARSEYESYLVKYLEEKKNEIFT